MTLQLEKNQKIKNNKKLVFLSSHLSLSFLSFPQIKCRGRIRDNILDDTALNTKKGNQRQKAPRTRRERNRILVEEFYISILYPTLTFCFDCLVFKSFVCTLLALNTQTF